VANGTENAVCVIETGSENRVTGRIPTGWYPGSVDQQDRKRIVCCQCQGDRGKEQRCREGRI